MQRSRASAFGVTQRKELPIARKCVDDAIGDVNEADAITTFVGLSVTNRFSIRGIADTHSLERSSRLLFRTYRTEPIQSSWRVEN